MTPIVILISWLTIPENGVHGPLVSTVTLIFYFIAALQSLFLTGFSLIIFFVMAMGLRVLFRPATEIMLSASILTFVVTIIGFTGWGLLLVLCLGFLSWATHQGNTRASLEG